MESAEQPANNLHKNVGKSLQQLGHRGSTIPPHEGQVLTEDLRGMIEDVKYNANSALEQAVSGGVTHVRTTQSRNPLAIIKKKLGLWK